MSTVDFINLCSDDEIVESGGKDWKRGPDFDLGTHETETKKVCRKYKKQSERKIFEEIRSSNCLSTSESDSSVLDRACAPADELSPLSLPSRSLPPICRQFWKAGNYEIEQGFKAPIQNGKNHLSVHPMFLHSNATSHKWAFGAIAELLDNAVDEIPNGATFVVIDEITNPRDGSPALLIQDDGGGMDPEALRRCMSFGFSDKNLISTIGQYGNGFKTSSMRLGADVIVFTCHSKKRTLSRSIGLLSYTFLRQTGHSKIVVPMVDYEFNASTRKFKPMLPHGKENFSSNLSILLQWSPYLTEEALLKQFDDIGQHGTKIVIYNLWLNDDGDLELDFKVHAEDIHISVGPKVIQKGHHPKPVFDHHIANLYHYSLRVYISILYLRLPESFKIILRGRAVEHHNIANDLKFFDFILYKPRVGGSMEAAVVTTIGFLKDAPHVDIHGFNIYHKNRLILPFWHVVNKTNRHGRGVVGVLEANFIKPIHSKQDFEKTPLFQKLETRLKEMTVEYWECYCEFIGYQRKKKSSPVSVPSQHGPNMKRKEQASAMELEHAKRPTGLGSYAADTLHIGVKKLASSNELQLNDNETILMQANEQLHLRLMGSEQREKELKLKVEQLRSELADKKLEYARMLAELESMDMMKMEKNVNG